MATGTGKTLVAFQICWKLWNARWNRKGEPHRKPRILYLADRNILVDDPKDKTFAAFGDARHKIEGGKVGPGPGNVFRHLPVHRRGRAPPRPLQGISRRDFFDLIIVDECHRGSARDETNWREILEYFEPAYQLGMTATPLREDNRDTYLYFGNPIYTYSLQAGHRRRLPRALPRPPHRHTWMPRAGGPSKGDLDRYGREIPDEEYRTPDFERVRRLARPHRGHRPAPDRFPEEDRPLRQDHRLLRGPGTCRRDAHARSTTSTPTWSQQYPDYVCRVTADEGDIGRGHMQRFQDVETRTPVILTTSQLLTTGVDAPTCRTSCSLRLVNSMVEFKQIIGRGTRVRDDYGKLWFNILDYTGTATRNFADPAFDGDPAFATQEEIDEHGKVNKLKSSRPKSRKMQGGEIHEPPGRHVIRRPATDLNVENSTTTAGRWKSPPNLSMNSTPTASNSVSSSSRIIPPKKCGHFAPARTNCAPAGPMPASVPTSSSNLRSAGLIFRPSRPRRASRMPTRSTCCVIWPSTRPCSPAASAPTA